MTTRGGARNRRVPPFAANPPSLGSHDIAMANSLWLALALILVIEGLLPFAAPRLWRDTFQRLIALSDGQLRFVGLVSIGAGLVSLALLHA